MTPLVLAQARHQQAIATLAAAETELLACMRAIEPAFTGTVSAMQDRRWESKLEGPRPYWELATAYGAYRRAQRAEAKARSAAHRARLAPAPSPAPAPVKKPRKKPARKITIAAYLDQQREARAA
jgi:hypothetical protein